MGTAFVLAWLLGWIASTAWRFVRSEASRPGDASVLVLYGLAALVWLGATALIAGQSGYVATTAWFGMDFAIAVPFAITLAFLVPGSSRESLGRWTASVSLREATFFHAVRVLALGTILKMMNGELAPHFIVPVGIPDFLFGLSAGVLGIGFRSDLVERRGGVVWNALGALVFAPSMVLLFLSVPSPIQIYFEGPTTREVFEFPMALVPTFIAPVFMLVHLAAISQLMRRDATVEARPARSRRSRAAGAQESRREA